MRRAQRMSLRRTATITEPLSTRVALRLSGVLLALCALCVAGTLRAHDVPNDVKVHAFVHPVGNTLQLLLRVPMSAMQDVDFPRRGVGFIDLPRADAALRTAVSLWITDNLRVYEDGRTLDAPAIAAARVSLPSDPFAASYDDATAQLARPPLPADTNLYWGQGMLDVRLDYRIRSENAEFALEPKLERLGLKTLIVLRYLPAGGQAERAFELHGNPGLVRLDPRWHQAALRFVALGFEHILDGTDHLLFIACLVLPLRRLRPLAIIVTGFTVAHSITLIAAALGYAPRGAWFPPLVEMLIAASIVYLALENIVGARLGRRWAVAFGFGLVHGFGFSFALADSLQFAGSHLITSLLAFNVGVELGQLLVLALLVPALALAFRYLGERIGIVVASALVAHTAWHWLQERFDKLQQVPLPAFDAAAAVSAMRVALVVVIAVAIAWLGRLAWQQWGPRAAAATSERNE